jgi:hypothetical protein
MADSPITSAAPPVAPVDQGATNTTAPQVAAPFNDAFADLDKISAEIQGPTKAPAAKDAQRKSAEAAKPEKTAKAPTPEPERPGMDPLETPPAEEKQVVEETPPADKPVETPPGDKPPTDAKAKNKGPWQMLRESQERIKELEAKTAAKTDEAASKAAQERLANLEKALAEKEREIQLADYTKSEDYAKNFLKPFTDAYTEARESVSQLQLTDPETGAARQATPADFDALMRVSDPNQAAEMIDAMFGTGAKAAEVAAMRRDILKLNQRRLGQVDAKRAEAAEQGTRVSEQKQKAQAEAAKTYTETLAKLTTERKEFFAPDDDAKGNEILEKSRVIADLAFGKQPEGKPPLSASEMARLHAVIHAKATGFDRAIYRYQQAQAKIATLEKELAEFRSSDPGKGDAKGSKGGQKIMSAQEAADAALEAMAH